MVIVIKYIDNISLSAGQMCCYFKKIVRILNFHLSFVSLCNRFVSLCNRFVSLNSSFGSLVVVLCLFVIVSCYVKMGFWSRGLRDQGPLTVPGRPVQ